MQEKIETIKEKEMERRRREKDKKKTGEVAVHIKGIPQTPQPERKVKDVPIYKVRIPLIQIKDTLHSEVLFPPKLRLHTGLRLVLVKPMIAQVPDAEMVRPPMLSSEHCFKLWLPSPLESSLKDSHLYHPPLIKYSPSVIPRRQMLQLIESVSVTSNVLQPLVFNRDVMPKDTQRTEKILQDALINERQKLLYVEVSDEVSSGDAEEEETFIEIMFQGDGLKKIEDGKPAVICIEDRLDESIIGVVETLCARLYREKKGGRPEPTIFTDIEEFKNDLRWMEAAKRIYVVQLSKNEWDELDEKDWKRFWNRLEQLFQQDVGFIILNRRVQRLLERHYIKIITVRPRQLTIEMKRKFTEIFWGFVDVKDAFGPLDVVFDYGRKKFENTLEGIKEKGFFTLATKLHEEGESDEHRWIKWFLVKHLANELIKKGELPKDPSRRDIQSKIETEVKGRFGNAVQIIPDVVMGNDVYEVETLFAENREGSIPSDKIIHTIDKYDKSGVNSINIVLSNITFIRHLKLIKKILRMYKKDGKENIKFWTLDLKNERLVSLEEILKIMRELKIQMEEQK